MCKLTPEELKQRAKRAEHNMKYVPNKSPEWTDEIQRREITVVSEMDLSEIYWINKGLTRLMPEFCNLVNIEELRLEKNSLTDLPAELSNLIHLRVLNLEENNFYVFPDAICSFTLSFPTFSYISPPIPHISPSLHSGTHELGEA